jgi:DNA polymerase-3 subunit delta'
MNFDSIIGHTHLKNHLQASASQGRIPHAQLFVGPEGTGTLAMAIAYAQYILCELNTTPEQKQACDLKFANFSHPDMHFAFPVATNQKIKSKPKSADFLEEWRQFLTEQPYGNLFDWYKLIGIENKQGQIGVDEAQEIVSSLSLKAYEGGYKIMIIWMAEKMNVAASNKLLKMIEEPLDKTLFLLVVEEEESLIQTILSRCQALHFAAYPEDVIKNSLIRSYNIGESVAHKIALRAHGNYNKALDLLNEDSEDLVFEKWFVHWVRNAFKARGNKSVVIELLQWSEEIAKTGRETQKQFLHFCLQVFRQAMMLNYNAGELVFMEFKTDNFKLEKFAPFVHENNILDIVKEIEDAIYHIERNGNAKIIFSDLSVGLTRLLHKKATVQ